jgi:thiaminase
MIKKINDDQLYQTILKSYNISDDFFLKYYSHVCLNNASDKQIAKMATHLLNIFSTETNETIIISGMQNLMRLEPQQIKPLFVKYFKTGTIGLRRAAYIYLKNEKDNKLLNEVIAVLKTDKSYEALQIINELEKGKRGSGNEGRENMVTPY